MSKELVVSATPHETRVALVEDGQLCEIYIEREKEFALVGSIYKGRVTRVLPGMQSAFVDIGLDSDAFLYVSDFLENLEGYDHVASPVEAKMTRMEQQSGQVFASSSAPMNALDPAQAPPPATGAAPNGGHTDAPPASTASPSRPPSAPHSQEHRDQYRQSGPGGFGRDRGRRGRWGQRGRDRDRRPSRDLPSSKYASPRPYEPRPYEPPPPASNEEPILLPGESLAKYKDRAGALVPPLSVEPPEPAGAPIAESHEVALSGVLPDSVFVTDGPHTLAPKSETVGAEVFSASAPLLEPVTETPPEPRDETLETGFPVAPATAAQGHELGAATREETSTPVRSEGDLSDEEVNTLAEQLAEAKHEEAQADAEAAAEGAEEEAEFFAESEEAHAAEETETTEAAGEFGARAHDESEQAAASEGFGADAQPPAESQPTSARIQDQSRARFQRPMRRGGRHRGGRPMRHHDRHAAQRRPQLISEMLKAGQEIIVQIAKEPLGKKGARITSHVALPGRYLVYMPTVDHIGVSRKIASAEKRSRLRRLVGESKGIYPGGFIVRTAAEAASDEEIRSDVEFLGRTWDELRGRAEQRKAPALLHRDLNLVERILRDYLSSDYSAIWVDSEEEYSKVLDFVSRFQPSLVNRVKLYTKDTPIFEEFGIQQELDKALRPKVWLKSGGYIVINHTEALVAIDVNTGKYVGRGSTRLEDTIVKTNVEAVKEVVRQIRLRDLGGIIVVDFIDMEERRNREKVMSALDDALRSDRAPSKVLPFNEFGLVAITRKRTKQALERVLSQPCPYCSGSGMVKSVPTICYEIQAEARKMAGELDSQSLTLRVNPEIAKALKTRESTLVEELEQATRKSIIIQSDPTLHWEQYDIY